MYVFTIHQEGGGRGGGCEGEDAQALQAGGESLQHLAPSPPLLAPAGRAPHQPAHTIRDKQTAFM
jgi:hypothetical protein